MIKYLTILLMFTTSILAGRLDSIETSYNEYQQGKKIDELYFKISAELAREYRYYNRDRAFQILDSTKPKIKDFLPSDLVGDVFNVYGNLYFDTGNFSKALENYYSCLSNAREIEDYGAVSFSYSDIGYCYYVLELYDISKYYYLKAYEFSMKDGVHNEAYPRSHSAISLALNYSRLGEQDSCFYYLNIGKQIREKDGDLRRLAQIYSYYGMVYYRDFDDPQLAIKYFEEAILLYEPDKNQSKWNENLGYTYNYLGMIELSVGNHEKGLKNIEEAIYRFSQNLDYLLPSAYGNKAQVYNLLGKKDSAIVIGENALNLSKKTGIVITTQHIHEILSDIYKTANNLEKSFYHKEQYYQIKDSLVSSKHLTALNTIETSLKLQEKEKKEIYLTSLNNLQTIIIVIVLISIVIIIVLFINRNKIQKESLRKIEVKNYELEQADITKDKFFSIIAHDLKNPVSTFKGSLEIMVGQYEIFDEDERKEMIQDLYKSAQGMQNLLDNLLTWARTQRGSVKFNQTDIDPCFLAENVKSIINQIALNKNINIEIKSNESNNKADPSLLNIVIMNITVNAIKFSEEGSKVEININENSESTLFEIKDYGVGMSQEETEKLFNLGTSFSKKGTNDESGTGLGLIICQEFVNLHNGEIWVESKPSIGTSFLFKIPK